MNPILSRTELCSVIEPFYPKPGGRPTIGIELYPQRQSVVLWLKAHNGVDGQSQLIHSMKVTTAKVYDSQVLDNLLQGDEQRVYGDSVYTGQTDQIHYVHWPILWWLSVIY